ncbi:MAG: ACP S-malonyltransferase, partial [Gammaproteobacteria bacterium]|nr:ACP S-malonyltransferase [Gammaproteobacteria bacterium]
MSLAFVFPGQGSQAIGMLADLADSHSIVTETFAQASEVLAYDLWQLSQQGPTEALNQTDKTQPAMLAAGVAVYRVWQQAGGVTPSIMAGHSLGEYTALVCAGALNFDDAISLVADRGRFMQEAVPSGEGAMAAILGMEDDQVAALCEAQSQGQVLSPVNYNSPGQVVIAGNAAAVQRAVDNAADAGAKKAVMLPVSVPSHCSLMTSAADRLADRLASINISQSIIPVIHNADVTAYEDADKIRDALVRQLFNPVRWVETIQAMASQGVDKIIECGPGKVLAGLNKRIDRRMPALPVFDPV